jgi:threonine dehydrogenase-like Zn-dependent dehydrogenase
MHLADRVAILGAGPIGILLLQTVRLQGAAHVTVVEKNKTRGEFALATGADRCLNDLERLESDHYDVVIDATGALSVMERTIAFARRGGTVLWFGVPSAGERTSVEGFEIFRKGLTLLSSFTSVRNSFQAVNLLRSGRIDVSALVSHRLPLDQFETGIALIEQGREDVRKVLLLPNGPFDKG